MKIISSSSCILIVLIFMNAGQKSMVNITARKYTLLALGDSYTVGESVSPKENFPNQTIKLLQMRGIEFENPVIIAKTGWTTDELASGISNRNISTSYDFVTLLIGVNNQYRGRNVYEYSTQFEALLKQAIAFASKKNNHVIVLSIPDWGATPFAEGKNRVQIANEIESYNHVNKSISEKYKIHYVDITPGSKDAAHDPTLVTGDKLHPSGKEYAKWARMVANIIQESLVP